MPSADQYSNLAARRSGSVAAEWRFGTEPADQVRRDLGNAAHAEQCHVAIHPFTTSFPFQRRRINSTCFQASWSRLPILRTRFLDRTGGPRVASIFSKCGMP